MLRVLGMFGLGLIFVAVSPALRSSLLADADVLQHMIEIYSPLSYVGIAAVAVAGLMVGLYRASQPRC